MKHDNICPFYGVCVDVVKPHHAFVAPWMPNGALSGYLKDHPDVNRTEMVSHNKRRDDHWLKQGYVVGRSRNGAPLSAFLQATNNS